MSEDTKEKYNTPYTDFGNKSSLKEYWDYTSTLETAERKGEKRGRADASLETARKMKADGMDLPFIMRYTGLPKDEIEAL